MRSLTIAVLLAALSVLANVLAIKGRDPVCDGNARIHALDIGLQALNDGSRSKIDQIPLAPNATLALCVCAQAPVHWHLR